MSNQVKQSKKENKNLHLVNPQQEAMNNHYFILTAYKMKTSLQVTCRV